MRACGQGYAGLGRFINDTNFSKPMTSNDYDKIVTKLIAATKEIAETTCEELRGILPVSWIRQFVVMDRGNDAGIYP